MLPHRLRPPSFATKELRAQKQQQEPNDGVLSGGGPIQRAMEKDLLELRPGFLQQIENLSTNQQNQQHCSTGEAFKCFKRIFGQAKVALVHTRTLPPRSDRGAYTQLLYSACLSLLKRCFEADNIMLEDAVFSIFCLYALYETCLLPEEPSSPLQLLPMGLLHPDNPKFLFRRTFRSSIRIDQLHYSLLQRLRDEALAQQADCQCARMKALKSRLDENATVEASSTEWSCSCGIFIDAVHVVDRLMPNLDLAEYTGPAGLEALAGHADYPYGCTRPKTKQVPTWNQVEFTNVSKLDNEALEAIVAQTEEATDDSLNNLDASIKHYKSCLDEIRLAPAMNAPTTNQASRVRNALKPIFDQPSQSTMNETLAGLPTATGGGAKANMNANGGEQDNIHVAAATATTLAHTTQSLTQTTVVTDNINQGEVRKSALEERNCDLVLPPDLSEAQRDRIRAALNSAIEAGDITIDPVADASNLTGNMGMEDGPPGVTAVSENLMDDEEDSIGQGGAALRKLLSQASGRTQPPVATVPRNQETLSSVNIFAGNDFLTTNLGLFGEEMSAHGPDESEMSDGSDVSTDIGAMSLQMLLSTVSDENQGRRVRQQKYRKRKKRKLQTSSGARGPRSKARPRKVRPSTSSQRAKADSAPTSESEDSDISIDVGRTSLEVLMSAAHGNHGSRREAMSPRREPQKQSKRRRSANSPVLRGQSKAASDDPPSMSSEDSINGASTSVGQAAIQTLFAAVDAGDGDFNGRKQSGDDIDQSHASDPLKTSFGKDREGSNSENLSESSDDDSVLSNDDTGKAALNALLSLATQH